MTKIFKGTYLCKSKEFPEEVKADGKYGFGFSGEDEKLLRDIFDGVAPEGTNNEKNFTTFLRGVKNKQLKDEDKLQTQIRRHSKTYTSFFNKQ